MPRFLLDYQLCDDDGPFACGRFSMTAFDEDMARRNAHAKVRTFDERADPCIDYCFQITNIKELEDNAEGLEPEIDNE